MDWTGQDDGNGPISVGRDRLLGLRLLPWIDKIVNTIEIFEKQIEYYVEVLCYLALLLMCHVSTKW